MGKSEIQKLRAFVNEKRLSGYRFKTEDQPWSDGLEPLRVDVCFKELVALEYPNAVVLKNEAGILVIDRLKHVRIDTYATIHMCVITLVTECGKCGSGTTRTYKIQGEIAS